jgi:hypothetical protein
MSSFYINGDIGDGTDTAIFCWQVGQYHCCR